LSPFFCLQLEFIYYTWNMKVDINNLSFNELPEEERTKILFEEGHFYNPFEIPDGKVLWNPYTFEPITMIDGETIRPDIKDGEQIFRNPLNSKIIRKVEFKDNKPFKAWKVTEDNRWELIEPNEDGTYDVNC